MLSAYSPASSLLFGKLNSPLSLLTTLTVTMPRLALITTPSMAPSSAEETLPVSAAGDCASASATAKTANAKIAAASVDHILISILLSLEQYRARSLWPRSRIHGGRRERPV